MVVMVVVRIAGAATDRAAGLHHTRLQLAADGGPAADATRDPVPPHTNQIHSS